MAGSPRITVFAERLLPGAHLYIRIIDHTCRPLEEHAASMHAMKPSGP